MSIVYSNTITIAQLSYIFIANRIAYIVHVEYIYTKKGAYCALKLRFLALLEQPAAAA